MRPSTAAYPSLGLLMLLGLMLAGCASTDRHAPNSIQTFSEHAPAAMPTFTFDDPDGKARTLADYRGRPILLNIWAPWCQACVHELPALAELQKAFRDTDLDVLALAVDRHGVARARTIYDALGVSGLKPFADDDADSVHSLGIEAVPTTILIDAQGREIGRVRASRTWNSPAVMEEIARRLGLPPPRCGAGERPAATASSIPASVTSTASE